MSQKKEAYLAALAEFRKNNLAPKSEGDVPAEPAAPVETQAELPLVEKTEAAPVAAAETPKEPAKAPEPTAAAPAQLATPAEPELFKGESLLDPDVRKEIRAKLQAQATAEAEAKKARDEFNRLHGKLAPTQQQLSRMQVENAAMQKRLNEYEAKRTDAGQQQIRARIEAMRQQFPEDAELWESQLNQITAVNQQSQTLAEKLQALEARERMNEERMQLTAAHPDWQKKTARIVQDESGNAVVQRTIDTPEAQELEVWANGMDPYERQVYWPLFNSTRAQDAIALLNRFEHDRALARQMVEQQSGAQQQQVPPVASAQAALTPDPDPSRRTTAPTRNTGTPGQPMSDKKQQYLDAAAFWERQRAEKAKQAASVRRR